MNYTELYELSMAYSQKIWDLVSKWPIFERDTIGKQIVRSSDSVSANLKEGYGRYSFKERNHFYYYSRGSLTETASWLEKSYNRTLIHKVDFDELVSQQKKILFQLNRLIKDTRSHTS